MGRLSRVDWTETSWCWVVFLGDPGRWVELVVCSAQHATNAAVLGELGRYPITLKLLIHSIKFWNRINAPNFSGFVKDSYMDSLDPQLNPTQNTWAQHIKSLLNNLNHSQVWHSAKEKIMPNNMKHLLETLMNKYATAWSKHINRNGTDGNKLRTYSKFKKLFKMEHYILCTPPALRKNFTKLRISLH